MVFGMDKEFSLMMFSVILGSLVGLLYSNMLEIYPQSPIINAAALAVGIIIVIFLMTGELNKG